MNHGGMDRRGFWIPGLASLARNDEKKKPLGRNDEKKRNHLAGMAKKLVLARNDRRKKRSPDPEWPGRRAAHRNANAGAERKCK
ncbi:MAG TPA: hypothetical protein ENK53_00085 [Thiotrichales bacterium]|nr:hypothetical protein [Thiotrichales bacterium]